MQISDFENGIATNLNSWLQGGYDSETKERIRKHLENGNEKELIDAFYKTLEFGTGGLRGIMGDGPNRMNLYTIGAATQGFANYLKKTFPNQNLSVAIAFDSRNRSQEFAQITADIFSANEINVFIFKELRPTPQLSYAIRTLACAAGVMLTASHNPKEYNGYKAYWNNGGQILQPHDVNIIKEVNAITEVSQIQFEPQKDRITYLDETMDHQYRKDLKKLSLDDGFVARQKDLGIVFSSIHGTGITHVPQTLALWGFTNVQLVEEQSIPNGNFPTVIYPNPEEEEAMAMCLQLAEDVNADVAMACDPDGDRVGIAVKNQVGKYILLNGNQIGSLLVNYVLSRHKELNKLQGNEFVVRTVVTTALIDSIAKDAGVSVYHTLTGFKYIGELISKFEGNQIFLVGGEESYGYLVGDLCRDKDAVVSCAFIAEMTAYYKDKGISLFDALLNIYSEHGLYKEKLISLTKKGKEGAEEIIAIMQRLRNNPPKELNNTAIAAIKDYKSGISLDLATGETSKIEMESSNVLQFITLDGSTISVRPSGTEPKIKFYCSVNTELSNPEDYELLSNELDTKVDALMADLLK